LAKSSGSNKESKCKDSLLMNYESVPMWLDRVCDVLDCTLQTLNLTSDVVLVDTEEDELHYDELSHDQSPHLLDTLQSYKVVDGDTMSLFYQLTLVLDISWTLRLSFRPLTLFTSAETHTLMATQPGIMSSIFTDHNSAVNKNRRQWISIASDASVGRIHPLSGGDIDILSYQNIQEQLMVLARDWFLSDFVKMCQVVSLYRAGHDDMAGDLRSSITDIQALSDRVLEVALIRMAKYIWGAETDSQGRLAAVPSSLVSHLAERQLESDSVADSSLVDTVALLGWISTHIENTDQHALATQALSAAQVLQVRSNRQNM